MLERCGEGFVEHSIMSLLKENKNIVISDCRYPNEFEMLRKYQCKFIRIYRNVTDHDWYKCYENGTNIEDCVNPVPHVSRYLWLREEIYYKITINYTLDSLEFEVLNLMTSYIVL